MRALARPALPGPRRDVGALRGPLASNLPVAQIFGNKGMRQIDVALLHRFGASFEMWRTHVTMVGTHLRNCGSPMSQWLLHDPGIVARSEKCGSSMSQCLLQDFEILGER